MRNWLIVYVGNVIGCLGTVLFVLWAGTAGLGDGAVAETAIKVAHSKADLSLVEAFVRGVLCNALVSGGLARHGRAQRD
jgi:formate transporter